MNPSPTTEAPSAPAPTRTSTARRVRYGAASAGIITCAALWMLLANLIAQDPRLRITADVTATGEHRLAPRTLQVLESLTTPGEIVIAGAAGTDPDVRRRIADVLDAMARTGKVRASWIDDPGGGQLAALLSRLVDRDAQVLASTQASLEGSAASIDQAADALDALDQALRELARAIPTSDASPGAAAVRQWATQQGDVARVLANDARSASASLRATLTEATALGVPPLDHADSVARRALAKLATDLAALGQSLERLASGDATPPEAVLRARAIAGPAEEARQHAARAADEAAARRVPDLIRVLRALESAECVLVVIEGGVTAIAFDELFPPAIPQTAGGARADIGVQGEDLLASAIASLISPASPIVVLMHAEDQRLIDQNAVTRLTARLALRRIDVLEWRLIHEPDPPSLSAIDPEGARPVVYVALATNAAAPASGPSGLMGADRAARLGAALRRLSDRAQPILLSINPSYLAASGGTDEALSFLADLGLRADTARPLMTQRLEAGRRLVDTDRIVTTLAPEGVSNPILDACAALPTTLRWAVPLEPMDPPAGVRATFTPLIRVADPDTWAERQWYNYWQIPADQRAAAIQPPTPDDELGDDIDGPWILAAAVERTSSSLPAPQRLVAVGSNGWFFDALAAQTEVVNGRVVPAFPGNAELFEAAVYWLARQEQFIARSAASGGVPTIRALDPTARSAVRWLVLGVMPLGVLALGVARRLIRG